MIGFQGLNQINFTQMNITYYLNHKGTFYPDLFYITNIHSKVKEKEKKKMKNREVAQLINGIWRGKLNKSNT